MALYQDMLKQPCHRCTHAYEVHGRDGCGACPHCPAFERAPQAGEIQLRIAVAQERIAAALEAKAPQHDGLVDHWRSQSEYHDQFVGECSDLLCDWVYDDDVAIEAIVQAGITRVVKALEGALPFLFASDGKSFVCIACNRRAWQAAGFTHDDHADECRLVDVTMPARAAHGGDADARP